MSGTGRRLAAQRHEPPGVIGTRAEPATFGVYLPGHYREWDDAVAVEMEPG